MIRKLLLAALCAMPMLANAITLTSPRAIVAMGCHQDGNICYVTLAGAPVGPASCTQNSVRWVGNDAGGKLTLSMLTAAFLANKNVVLAITDQCFTPQPIFPTLLYYNIHNE